MLLPNRLRRNSLVIALALLPAPALADHLASLTAAYGLTRDGNTIVFAGGTRMDAGRDDPNTSFEARLTHASIADMFHLAYPRGAPIAAPPPDFDAGRFRNKAFFDSVYGDCRKGAVEKHLVSVVWLPKSWGHAISFAPRGAQALRDVSAEIDVLPPAIKRAAWPIAGTYSCRSVADVGQPSMHAYGAAIDLNLRYSDYWLWEKGTAWRNRMPAEIVQIFERHGFIWGGRWAHYDTMHFEYRPELLAPAPAPR